MGDTDDTWLGSHSLSRRSFIKGAAAGVAVGVFGHAPSLPLLAASPSVAYFRGSTSSKQVALTFDCGSDLGYTKSILDTAKTKGVKLTFGMTGQFARAYPTYVKRMVTEGHGPINHSDTHPSFTGFSWPTTALDSTSRTKQLQGAEDAIYAAAGVYAKPYFRPPFGDYNASVLQFLGDKGYGWTIMWTIDLLGWDGLTRQQIIDRAMANHGNGYIYLMHVGSASQEGPAFAAIVDGLKAKGYSFVRVSQMTGATSTPPTGGYKAGTKLKVTAGLYLRTGAGTGTGVITTMPTGTIVTVVSGPIVANGLTWYQVDTPYGRGWAAGEYMTPTTSTTPTPTPPPPISGGYKAGTKLKVTAGLYLRTGAGTGTGVITTMPTGTIVTVVSGPIAANGLTWYQVDSPYGRGWAAGEYMTPTTSTTPPPTTSGYPPGTKLRVTAGLYLRSGAGTGTTVYTTMPTGTIVTVVSGPIVANGLTWYQVDTPYGRGWAAGEYMKP